MSQKTVDGDVFKADAMENFSEPSNSADKNEEEKINEEESGASGKNKPNTEADSSNIDYDKHITYDEKGIAIYTDPTTKVQYIFDTEKNQWVPKSDGNQHTAGNNPYENEYYRWCTESNEWILKENVDVTKITAGSEYENEHYKWDAELKKWVPKNGDQKFASSEYKDGQHLYTDADGVVFFWDPEKKAWFPKIDDDFMAVYQTNYGFIDNTSTASSSVESSNKTEANKITPVEIDAQNSLLSIGKRKASKPEWFDEAPETCTKVYVSNLPEDEFTEEEFIELMSKCGMIMRDPQTKKMKVKLYAEPSGQLKGDGLCNYIRVESVQLALDMLDGYDVHGRKIKVERAKFQMRGEYNPKLKPRKKKQDKEKLKKMQDKLLAWRPEKMRGERSKFERVVILKNLFTPETFENKVDSIIDYQNMVRDECAKCGTVKKVIIYSGEPEGICEIRMSDAEEADLVVQMMDRRLFGERTVSAETWDGHTKYKKNETDAECSKRLSKWDEFLEQSDDETPKENSEVEKDTNCSNGNQAIN